MFYRDINLPVIVEIKPGIARNVDDLLQQNHIYYKKKVLFTQKELLQRYESNINIESYSDIITIKGGQYEETEVDFLKSSSIDALFVAFGGGSTIDFVKMYATKLGASYITLPTALSNDAIYSPIARLTQNGIKKSFGVKSPIGIIVDTLIIKQAPMNLIYAGIGDLISNISAIKDCNLAIERHNENIDSFSIMLSRLSTDGIIKYSKKDVLEDYFIEKLAIGLILSGLSMILANSSRPASGAEHLISHAIDQYYPEKSVFHGFQVAWAQLMLEKNIRHPNDYDFLYNYYQNIGLLNSIEQYHQLNNDFFYKLIPLALKVRKRFTILNTLNYLSFT